ncbi:MAG: hypothetical protein HY080_06370 [Gammaproteobacteria bacterium]|nr:hypothetical protein [Gammaproteobacteria bacterium]
MAADSTTFNFDTDTAGTLAPGWLQGATGGGTAKWAVEPDTSVPSRKNVLKQSGNGTFLWCVRTNEKLENGFVEVKFKPLSGDEDRAGGVVWRFKDANNYYVARANALEDNVTIYHTLHGHRVAFSSSTVRVAANQWHSLRVDFNGNRFTVTYDGKKVIEASDASITGAGTVGMWTKADSVTAFDNFTFGAGH